MLFDENNRRRKKKYCGSRKKNPFTDFLITSFFFKLFFKQIYRFPIKKKGKGKGEKREKFPSLKLFFDGTSFSDCTLKFNVYFSNSA